LDHYFFFNDTATTEIYTLSLHDALPIFHVRQHVVQRSGRAAVEERLREREDRKQRGRVESVRPERSGGGGAHFVDGRGDERAHRTQLSDELRVLDQARVGRRREAHAAGGPQP